MNKNLIRGQGKRIKPEAIEGYLDGSYFLFSYSPKIKELLCIWPKQAPQHTNGNFKPVTLEMWENLKERMMQVDYIPYNNEFQAESWPPKEGGEG
jgi:hypothetical protein